jgi:chromosome segregation ATPase
LTQSREDSATISKALSHNKDLKSLVTELEGKLVSLTNTNMALVSEAGTLRHEAKQLTAAATATATNQQHEIEALQAQIRTLKQTANVHPQAETIKTQPTADTDTHRLEALQTRIRTLEHDRNEQSRVFELLQTKFTAVMADKANLVDRLAEEERLTTQLALETDTIAEFIMLYRVKRDEMLQRAHEKDEFIACVLAERDTLQTRLQRQTVGQRPLQATEEPLVVANEDGDVSFAADVRDSMALTDAAEHIPNCPCCTGQVTLV